MSSSVSKIENNVQDRTSTAWKRLCEYVDKAAKEKKDEFSPWEELEEELFSQIHTLPETISTLKHVKKIWLYGSELKRIPPEIGEMKALKYLDIYTSYDLHWLPYEITNCKNLIDSRVSTRALYGNHKTRMHFPSLLNNPVRYADNTVKCSICKKEMTYEQTNQLWISLQVATDVFPLLANLCSKKCENKLPRPPKGYLRFAHKGGTDLKQPTYDDWMNANTIRIVKCTKNVMSRQPKLLKVIRKIWER